MNTEAENTIKTLRDAGYLVVIWTPQELGNIDSSFIEDVVIERGNDMIEQLQQETV